ncbi:hypothetical protein B0H14DRAFT_1239982 [Mycena olivaceomarginata]|nr:hypothetical protein B0H14DRAFT_1239982 [Mycena olivaceomarginata]
MSSAWWTRWASVCWAPDRARDRVVPHLRLRLRTHSRVHWSFIAGALLDLASPRTSYPNVHTATGYCHRVPHRDDAQWTQQPLVDCLVLHGDSTLEGMSGCGACLTRLNPIGTRDSGLLEQDSMGSDAEIPFPMSYLHSVTASLSFRIPLSLLLSDILDVRLSSPPCRSIPQRPKARIHSLVNAQRHSGDYERLAEIAFHRAK